MKLNKTFALIFTVSAMSITPAALAKGKPWSNIDSTDSTSTKLKGWEKKLLDGATGDTTNDGGTTADTPTDTTTDTSTDSGSTDGTVADSGTTDSTTDTGSTDGAIVDSGSTDTTTDTGSTDSTTDGTVADSGTSEPVAPAAEYRAVLSWDVPTQRENGDSLAQSELSYYEVMMVDETTGEISATVISDVTATRYQSANLASGDYSFSIVAVDQYGLTSPLSDIITVSVP